MGGAAVNDDAVPAEALVRDSDSDLLAGRLRHDGRIGNHHPGGGLRAGRGELLVADGGDHHVAGQVAAERTCGRHHDRGEAGLHVVGPAAVEAIAVDAGPKWIGHPVDADDVHVRIQEQRAAAAAAAGARDHIRAAGLDVGDLDLQTALFEPAADEPCDLGLSRAAWHQPRVDRVDRHQLGQERSRLVVHRPHPTSGGSISGRRRRRRREPERRPRRTTRRGRAGNRSGLKAPAGSALAPCVGFR